MNMKIIPIVLALTVCLSQTAYAAPKPCEELKTEIAEKLDEKGVKDYTLEIVENDKVADAKVIGSCDAGAKKITYLKK